MGEAKQKKSQVFRIELAGEQRKMLFDLFRANNPEVQKEREDRRRLSRAYAALELGDFKNFRPTVPDDPSDAKALIAASDEYEARLAAKDWAGTVTRENVDMTLKVIQTCMKQGLCSGVAALALDDVEELLEQCQDGKHAVVVDEPAPEPVAASA
jgi:hypothetical protein